VNYANYPTGSSGPTVYLFEQSVPLQAGKSIEHSRHWRMGARRLSGGTMP
jgi:hypothetical protein